MMYGENFLGPPHGTTPAAAIANKIKLRFFKGSEYIYEKGNVPYCGFGYSSLFSGNMEAKRIAVILQLLTEGDLSNNSNHQIRTRTIKKDMMI